MGEGHSRPENSSDAPGQFFIPNKQAKYIIKNMTGWHIIRLQIKHISLYSSMKLALIYHPGVSPGSQLDLSTLQNLDSRNQNGPGIRVNYRIYIVYQKKVKINILLEKKAKSTKMI